MTESLILTDEPTGTKLAEKIAYQLEQEIVASGFPVGKVLGSETALIARLGISRAVFREAIRVLEHHGVATMRRGPGGGLVVTAPETHSAVRATALMLEYMKASPQHVFEARSALELKCVELATEKIDESGIVRLRETLAQEQEKQHEGDVGTHGLHTALAEMTGNPALALFVEVLTNLSRTGNKREHTPQAAADVRVAHQKIADAVIAGDAAVARHRMQVHLAAVGKWLTASPRTRKNSGDE
ncbi:FadR/GntR family transcriptional regulator [Streptomyces sp. UG1]|uniref:FadR/GntR family transcriptional regulator n=1 Tax=Streptomyces sp. UG1 TaxID=3417652 RepID=UPI003CEA93F6